MRTLHERDVRHIIAYERDIFFLNLGFAQHFLELFYLVPGSLLYESHAQFTGASRYQCRSATGDDAGAKTCAMQEHYAVAVARVKALFFVAIAEERDATVSENAVAVHQKKTYAVSAPPHLSYLL